MVLVRELVSAALSSSIATSMNNNPNYARILIAGIETMLMTALHLLLFENPADEAVFSTILY
jgi:hypothetical protein